MPVVAVDDLQRAAARSVDEARGARKKLAGALRARGGQLQIGGIALATIGLITALIGILATEETGRPIRIWAGGIVVGLGLVMRGRSMMSKACRLDD